MHHRRRRPLREDLPPEVLGSPYRMRIMVGTLAINNHPSGISVEDLRFELARDKDDRSIDQAIDALVADGLLRRRGQMISVTFLPSTARVQPTPRRRRCRLRRQRGHQH
jgi:hypothetical protein